MNKNCKSVALNLTIHLTTSSDDISAYLRGSGAEFRLLCLVAGSAEERVSRVFALFDAGLIECVDAEQRARIGELREPSQFRCRVAASKKDIPGASAYSGMSVNGAANRICKDAKIASGIANADRERLGAIAASRVSVTISMPVGSVKKGHLRGVSLLEDVRKWSC